MTDPAGPALIDLDLRGGPVDDAVASEPMRRRRMRALTLVVAVAAAVSLTASAPQRRPAALVWSARPAFNFGVVDDTVVAYNSEARTLDAYRLSDGQRRWRLPQPGEPSFSATAGTLLVVQNDPVTGSPSAAWLDARTGDPIALIRDTWLGLAPDGSLLTAGFDSDPIAFGLVSRASGAQRVVLRVPADTRWTNDPDNREIAWWDAAGVLHTHEVLTGVEHARDIGLRPPPVPPTDISGGSVAAAGDLWLVTLVTSKAVTVAAFGRADLTPRWRRTFPVEPDMAALVGQYVRAVDCDPLVCLPLPEPGALDGTKLLDAADGRTVRASDRRIYPLGSTRWQALAPSSEGGPVLIMDVVAGAVPYPAWSLVGVTRDGRYLMASVRRTSTEYAVFDSATGALVPLGVVPMISHECEYVPPYLVCLDHELRPTVRVWRLPTP